MSSFALRAKKGREESGSFTFPPFEGWTMLKGWKFGLSKNRNPMFTLTMKVLERGELYGKQIKERVTISKAAEWQFDKFLAYLEDSGIDLSKVNDKDPNYQDIQDILGMLEDAGQKIRLKLEPQEEDKRYYRLTFLEVEKIGEAGGPIVVDPADDEDPGHAPDDTAPEPEEEAPPPPPVRRAATVAPAATKPAVTAPAATTAAPAKKPWQR